jgi:pimeloyl-ACP methyl ester carboxylesterase
MTQQTFRIAATAESPSLSVRRQPHIGSPAVLYIHGATFPSALSVGFSFGNGSWMDDWNARGFDAWAFDFAGFGESGRYAAMTEPADRHPPLLRAAEAARQIGPVLEVMAREIGLARVSLVAHSWGGAPAALAAIAQPERIDRLVLFRPVARPTGAAVPAGLPAWADITNEAQYRRFVEDVPKDHAPVLEGFDRWAPAYLASDPDAAARTPPAVRVPYGPAADYIEARVGRLAWDPARLTRPLSIVRGAWDSVCSDADATLILDAATAAPSRHDRKLDAGTHLMHLETGRHALYEAVGQALKGQTP